MFDELIAKLDSEGVQYTEDYEAGTLTISVEAMDKIQLVSVIQTINNAMLPFTIDETSLIVTGGSAPEEPPAEPEGEETPPAEEMALNDMFK